MARQPDATLQQRWLDRVQRWQQSHLTVRAFCERHGLGEANFYLWRRVLRERGLLHDQAPTRQARPAPGHAAFVAVTVDPQPVATTAVEVVLNDRRRLRVQPGFDPATLLQLVRLLEEPAC